MPTESRPLTYDEAARVVALHLADFYDESLPYPDMIADAARKAALEIWALKADVKALKKLTNIKE